MRQDRRLADDHDASNAVAASTQPGRDDRFSVILPVLDEELALPHTLRHLECFPEVAEVLVVDGGSSDASVARARAAGVRVLEAPRGRGTQCNTGARHARHENLLFLHADCRLPADAFSNIRQAFAEGHGAGVFRIDYGERHLLLRALSALSHLPTRWTQFGEAALFVQRHVLEAAGGFPDWPLMEDVEVLARLRRRHRLAHVRGVVRASPRRFLQQGVTRQLARNLSCYLLFHCGVPPARLLHLYDGNPPASLRQPLEHPREDVEVGPERT